LIEQVPNAVFVPEEVCIDLRLMNPSSGMGFSKSEGDVDSARGGMSLGPVFVVNKQTVSSWSSNRGDVIPGLTVQVPKVWGVRDQLMIFTRVRVYKDQVLSDYESGLTCPQVINIEEQIKSDDTLRCSYLLGSDPHLVFEREG